VLCPFFRDETSSIHRFRIFRFHDFDRVGLPLSRRRRGNRWPVRAQLRWGLSQFLLSLFTEGTSSIRRFRIFNFHDFDRVGLPLSRRRRGNRWPVRAQLWWGLSWFLLSLFTEGTSSIRRFLAFHFHFHNVGRVESSLSRIDCWRIRARLSLDLR
jgi:hypothetical protein